MVVYGNENFYQDFQVNFRCRFNLCDDVTNDILGCPLLMIEYFLNIVRDKIGRTTNNTNNDIVIKARS